MSLTIDDICKWIETATIDEIVEIRRSCYRKITKCKYCGDEDMSIITRNMIGYGTAKFYCVKCGNTEEYDCVKNRLG